MALGVSLDILNQKGTPAFFSDIFANRPAFGFAGRVFISTDTGAIYEDTGTAWTLIADAGAGTTGTLQQVTTNGNTTTQGISITAGGLSANSITNTSLTTGSIAFVGAAGLMTQDNANFFWDDTNNRLGIATATPGTKLDIHGTGTIATFNGTSTNNGYIGFQNAGVTKWLIGNTYNTAINSFDIYDSVNAISILSITNTQSLTFLGTNSSRFEFSDGKFSSTRTSAAINLTFSAENRQTPAIDVGSSFGFYGGATGNNVIAELRSAWEGASTNNGYFVIETVTAGSRTEKLRVNSSGFVGINTITPTFFLDVSGNGRFTSNLTATAFIPTGSSVPTNGMYLSAANTLNFATNSANKLTISSGGTIRASGAMNLDTSDIVYATGTTTIFTITSEVNSHYLVVAHDPNSVNIYASAIVIVNATGTISNVINLGSLGGITINGTGTSVQVVNVAGAANGRNSIIRMR